MRRSLSLIVSCLLLAAMFAGCATYQFATPNASWQSVIGQLQYVSPKRSIIGETVVTRDGDQNFQLDFMTGPGLPILKLRKEGNKARAEAAFARVSWQGSAEHPVGPLKSWFALNEVFTAISGLHQTSGSAELHSQKPGFWNAKATVANGKPVDVRIEFPGSKEQFNFHFAN